MSEGNGDALKQLAKTSGGGALGGLATLVTLYFVFGGKVPSGDQMSEAKVKSIASDISTRVVREQAPYVQVSGVINRRLDELEADARETQKAADEERKTDREAARLERLRLSQSVHRIELDLVEIRHAMKIPRNQDSNN